MKLRFSIVLPLVFVSVLSLSHAASPQAEVQEAEKIFIAQQKSSTPIPAQVLRQAKAVGIIKVFQGGIILGGSIGEGVLLTHQDGSWSTPTFFHLGSHTAGLQLGANVHRYVFVLNTNAAVETFTGDEDKQFRALAQYTSENDHDSAVATDEDHLPAASLSIYSVSEGAYVGATIGDALVGNSPSVNYAAYGVYSSKDVLSSKTKPLSYASNLQKLIRQASRVKEYQK